MGAKKRVTMDFLTRLAKKRVEDYIVLGAMNLRPHTCEDCGAVFPDNEEHEPNCLTGLAEQYLKETP